MAMPAAGSCSNLGFLCAELTKIRMNCATEVPEGGQIRARLAFDREWLGTRPGRLANSHPVTLRGKSCTSRLPVAPTSCLVREGWPPEDTLHNFVAIPHPF